MNQAVICWLLDRSAKGCTITSLISLFDFATCEMYFKLYFVHDILVIDELNFYEKYLSVDYVARGLTLILGRLHQSTQGNA